MGKQKASSQQENSSQVASYYEILGVSQDASQDEIKTKYKALVLKFHPDKESSALAREAMVLINNAYEVLSDPERRAAYDITLKIQATETRSGPSPKPRSKTPFLGKVLTRSRIQTFIILAILIPILVGYVAETSQANGKAVADQFVHTNGNYYTAVLHDVPPSLPLIVPIFGIAWGVLAGFTAGFIDKGVIMTASALHTHAQGYLILYAILALALKGAGYFFGMCRSLDFVRLIKKRRFNKWDMKFTAGDILFLVILTMLAGYVEHAMANTV